MKQRFFKTVDPVGAVFFKSNKVLRGINTKFEEKTRDILIKCKTLGLIGNSIVFTKEYKKKLENYPFEFFLEHEKVDPFTYPGEWSSKMIYDSGLMILNLFQKLSKKGLYLKDCQIFNTVFNKGKFVFIDFGTYFNAKKRFKSDLVLALAIIHHLVFFQRVTFKDIVRQLKSFSNKYLIVEFIHKHDQHVKNWDHNNFGWYSIYNFEQELNKYFRIIKKVNTLRDERTLIFCELI
ncbi:hypothetical protein GF385_00075 [Candidatus Dependentiae bacterium]|nr:hypothetical protein [Candidatus Dependentiae bacterium]